MMNDKKNGTARIMTFHAVENYGAVLQTYALNTILRRYYDTVEVIDYRPKSVYRSSKILLVNRLPSFIRSVISMRSFLKKCGRFKQFIKKEFILRKPTNISDEYTLFLGSDQIWNPTITSGFDPCYFGDAPYAKGALLVSYAASIGQESLSEKEKMELSKLMRNIRYVSVREQSAADLLNSVYDGDVKVVVDPTLLLRRDDYAKIIDCSIQNGYVLIYTLSEDERTIALAEKIAAYLGKDLVMVSGRRKKLVNLHGIKTIYDAGPIEFLSYVAGADYVVTDSFHGTIFSLQFHRPFVSVITSTRGTRVRNLLSIVGLEKRISVGFNHGVFEKIDWEAVERKIEYAREQSLQFIEKVAKT